jgi:hypothetical protein
MRDECRVGVSKSLFLDGSKKGGTRADGFAIVEHDCKVGRERGSRAKTPVKARLRVDPISSLKQGDGL